MTELALTAAAPTTERDPPVFLLSFRQRDELAALAAQAGWRVVAARRTDGAERRLLASGAAIAVVDARGAIEDGLAAVRALAGVAGAIGGALLVLVSRGHAARLGEFYDAGATHFLASPMKEAEFVQALRFAARHAERVGGGSTGVEGAADALGWRYDPALQSMQVTPALAAMLGLSETPSVRAMLRSVERHDRGALKAALARLRGGLQATAFAHELAGAGRVVEHLQVDVRTGRVHALIERLSRVDAGAAVREALAGVRNAVGARRWVQRRLGERHEVGIVLVTLSRFDVVNTAYGRPAGDAVLRTAAARLAQVARETLGKRAIVARMGGAEFLIAAESVSDAALAATLAQIEDVMARPFVVEDAILPMGARLASALSQPDDDVAALLKRASEALAGEGGSHTALSVDALAVDLRRALDQGEIELRFQPQVVVATGALVGVEALARWEHPALGQIGAEALFAAADRAGLALALSEHVQRKALSEAAHWPAELADLRLAVNVTSVDVARSNFVDLFLDWVDGSGFPRSRLTVEITEGGLIADIAEASRLLGELRAAGCRVAIDDFGTGYSSLAYLKSLPLDYLKIDRKLTQDIAGSVRDRVVVRGVIDMARSLGLAVVAEGVETDEQLELLAKEGCQFYQGFLFAQPLTGAELAARVGGG
ncbi:putative bifunctional diguanylate cyclase/phosphodiesterase [Sphingomonas turrisvirgatae]|uniref:Diguanylate cyclase n=1 Tax=Sphingomonas turrisvirgatae TaxID=1888892 RepID=A0A1E3LZY2_9SPHN|nr:GGDEF domain-containing phosphodiesterase [Sphingomonas turrisvirgatae]ODP39352.1 diguanylate cyclase [Sphingomonas turrisvirgatae]